MIESPFYDIETWDEAERLSLTAIHEGSVLENVILLFPTIVIYVWERD